MASPPVAEAATELGIELLQAESVNRPEAVEAIKAAGAELGVVCAFGQLIKEPLLSELEMLNVHPSLLPRWRGAAPIERSIMAGDPETGVSILRVTEGLDSGPVALRESLAIDDGEDYGSLSSRLAGLGGDLLVRALDERAAGALELVDQDDALATYAEKISPEEHRLDPSRPARELELVVRALNPHHSPYLELDGGVRLVVRSARAEPEMEVEAGQLAGNGTLRLGCAEGTLELRVVQPEGRRPMPADAYLRGHALPSLAG